MSVYQLVAQTVPLRSSGSRFPFSVVTTLNAGKEKADAVHCSDYSQSEIMVFRFSCILDPLSKKKRTQIGLPYLGMFV